MDTEAIVKEIVKMTDQAKTMGDLHQILRSIAYAIGGMVCQFEQDDRSHVAISLTEAIGLGLMNTSKFIGEPCSLEMVVGEGEQRRGTSLKPSQSTNRGRH